jgi:hypothetical protein
MGSHDEGERVPNLVWRVKLVAEFETGETTEVEVARLERDEQAGLADLGLRLAEAKRLTAAIQAEIVPAQVAIAGENRRTCLACGCVLASKGHYTSRRNSRLSFGIPESARFRFPAPGGLRGLDNGQGG